MTINIRPKKQTVLVGLEVLHLQPTSNEEYFIICVKRQQSYLSCINLTSRLISFSL